MNPVMNNPIGKLIIDKNFEIDGRTIDDVYNMVQPVERLGIVVECKDDYFDDPLLTMNDKLSEDTKARIIKFILVLLSSVSKTRNIGINLYIDALKMEIKRDMGE